MPHAIGFDIGGTKIAAGLVHLQSGEVTGVTVKPSHVERGGDALLADVESILRDLIGFAISTGAAPQCIGLGLPELVGRNGEVLSAALFDWRTINVVEKLRIKTLVQHVWLDADVRAAAAAEAHWGAGRGSCRFLYVTIGTGISCCLVLDGLPDVGVKGLTGTFASSALSVPSSSGQIISTIHLEQFASGPALVARYQTLHPDFNGSTHDLLFLGDEGNPEANEIISSAGIAVGSACAHLVNVLDVDRIVIGGGLGVASASLLQTIKRTVRDGVWSEHHRNIEVIKAELGALSGVIGAGLQASQTMGRFVGLHSRF